MFLPVTPQCSMNALMIVAGEFVVFALCCRNTHTHTHRESTLRTTAVFSGSLSCRTSNMQVSQQLASSTCRGQSGKPSQIMLALMHTLLPGHSHRERSEQPDRHAHTHSFVNLSVRLHHKYIFVFSHRLTTVLLVAVVVTVQVSVTAFGRQDTATRSTLEVTGRALCHNQEQQEKLKTLFFLLLFTVKRGLGGGEWCLSVPSTPASGSRQVTFPPSSGNWLQSESSGHCSPTMPSTDSHFSLALRHSDLGAEMYEQVLGA